ncbi:MAG: hypothetical protein AVDCRST_MAG89-1790 [uncultured Gemmatimonadetes bacterium]|uniref:Uncharacterized protein n=1 Tax=uncultured Gemmatimonadota bacterium TaxID=203437 RepID=A0A6J4LB10_9BACT|nr:MAG: hypothetical protein AVDCRST_MAG89-1790 [uncultured Gemmatimonadota bacterium]
MERAGGAGEYPFGAHDPDQGLGYDRQLHFRAACARSTLT